MNAEDRAALEETIDVVGRALSPLPEAVVMSPDSAELLIAAARAHLATLPKTQMAWLVTESSYGKTTGWRHFLDLDEALRTVGIWVRQSAGDITIGLRGVS